MRMIRSVLAVALLAIGTQAEASSQSGYIIRVAYTGSRIFVWLDGTDRNGASCNTAGAGTRYEVDGSSPTGQSQLSILLTNYSLRQKVQISGSGLSCATDTETIVYFTTLP